MRPLNRRQFLALTGSATLALAAPSIAFAEGGTLADIRKRGVLTVGTEAAYEPCEFVENGKVT
ncbi:twin-arginine translocation signal domain-containing protein, partial [Burkholderia anthina]|uniref:twin-arginine translocation signal domain-containing protein n=1 Tax=Burkholderia anthina TaxID=179879 RepID=UPI00158889A5